ncbi:MAG: acyltransferase [Thermodesulfobacteriota bacterium]|nr:acyltransferase [Thermodesulfobacteriota bacterium]
MTSQKRDKGTFPLSKERYEKERGPENPFRVLFCKVCGLVMQFVLGNALRVRLLKAMGVSVGKGVFIGKYCIIDDTFPELITIEDEANISFGVAIISHDASRSEVAPVLIKRGVFLGARSVILPGVTIGEKSVVGAGSVVTRDVPPNTIVAGVPAKAIRSTDAGAEKGQKKK